MGGLPISMSKDEFFKGVSKPRNKVLMRVFKDMDLVEQLGSGMNRILNVYDPDIYEISDNFIRVTFKYSGERAGIGGKSADELTNQEKILRYANEHREFKTKHIQELLGLQKSRTRQIISKLCSDGKIARCGLGKGTYYTIKKM